MPPDDRTCWVALSLVPGLGSRLIARLLDHLGTLEAILAADESALRAVSGIGPVLARTIRGVDVAQVARAMAAWQAEGIVLALRADPISSMYPARLLALADAPPVLFMRGTVQAADHWAVAVVGTRQPSQAGRQRAEAIAAAFAALRWTVVSGLAAGIDAAAHRGALTAGGADTGRARLRCPRDLSCGGQISHPPGFSPQAAHW